MDVEEVRKRKGEAEEVIKGIIQQFIDDTHTDVTKIEMEKQLIAGVNYYGKITGIIMKVQLYSK